MNAVVLGFSKDREYRSNGLMQIIHQWTVGRICIAVVIQGLMLLAINQLLLQVKLSDYLGTILLSEVFLILIVAPYLSSYAFANKWNGISSDSLLLLSPIRSGSTFGMTVIGSQIPLICFVILSTLAFMLFAPSSSDVSHTKILYLHLVLGVYVFSSASVGMLGWRIFCHEVFAAEFAYLVSLFMIGGVFLLSALNRYLDDLLIFDRFSIISVFLFINPLVAVCHLFEIDIFRTPYLYELTPIPSYLFVYPKWYTICGGQALIGLFCLVVASRMGLKRF